MDLLIIFRQLGVALGLGLLVGLQREHKASRLAGIRTFPLVTLLGTISAYLAQSFGGWIIAAGLISVAAMIVIGNVPTFKERSSDSGLTTEMAMLLMFTVGAYIVIGSETIAIAVGAGTAVLLQFKGQLHGIAARLGDDDLKAIMQFALISLVILPVLPDRAYGPYSVLNPRQIWWMVVLITGISLGGYIAYKFFGERAGVLLGGMMGGLISSTATTVSYARRTVGAPEGSRLAAVVIMMASSVVFLRVLLEIAVVAPSLLRDAALQILIMFFLFVLLSAGLWFSGRREKSELPPQQNPSELKAALFFGALYAIVLLAVSAAKDQFGDRGLYIVAAISGLTDVDAITLSTSQMVNAGRLSNDDGWRVIVVAIMSNLFFKGVTVAALGHRRLLATIGWYYGAAMVGGILVLALWP